MADASTGDIDARLKGVVAAVFGVPEAGLADESSPRTIEAWDSVAHIQLILAVEAEFGVQFEPEEIAGLNSVGALRERLEQLVGGAA